MCAARLQSVASLRHRSISVAITVRVGGSRAHQRRPSHKPRVSTLHVQRGAHALPQRRACVCSVRTEVAELTRGARCRARGRRPGGVYAL